TPALVAAPDLLRRRFRPVRKGGDAIRPSSPPEDFHALRIRGKRVRYAGEFGSPPAPKPSEKPVPRPGRVHDRRGGPQAREAALPRLRGMAEEEGLPPRAVFLLGRIDERYEIRARGLREAFPEVYAGIRGKAWDRLRRVLDERRRRALAAQPPPRVTRLRPA